MLIAIPRETLLGESRIAMTPTVAEKLIKLGSQVAIESGLGNSCGYTDNDYTKVGCQIVQNRLELLGQADMILRINKPSLEEIQAMKKGSIHISYLNLFQEKDLLNTFAQYNISAISLEMIPRTTIAQKMDVLSSQGTLTGYVSVIIAAERLSKIFPMMTTAAGTVPPAKVFILGAGVIGLQAIATAKRLGARVEAYDTRTVVEEQVLSLGAKFIKIDVGETGQTKDGYAKQLSDEQLQKQREAMGKHCASSDVVITTAQVFGKKAPLLITKEMIAQMKPGSIIIDLAVESGGNVEGSQMDQEVIQNGVKIIGLRNLPSRVAMDASQMFATNLYNLISHFWDRQNKTFICKTEDEIIKGCLVVHQQKVLPPQL